MTLMSCDRCGQLGLGEYYADNPSLEVWKTAHKVKGLIFSRTWAYSLAMSGPHGKWIDVCEDCNNEIEAFIFKLYAPTRLN